MPSHNATDLRAEARAGRAHWDPGQESISPASEWIRLTLKRLFCGEPGTTNGSSGPDGAGDRPVARFSTRHAGGFRFRPAKAIVFR